MAIFTQKVTQVYDKVSPPIKNSPSKTICIAHAAHAFCTLMLFNVRFLWFFFPRIIFSREWENVDTFFPRENDFFWMTIEIYLVAGKKSTCGRTSHFFKFLYSPTPGAAPSLRSWTGSSPKKREKEKEYRLKFEIQWYRLQRLLIVAFVCE